LTNWIEITLPKNHHGFEDNLNERREDITLIFIDAHTLTVGEKEGLVSIIKSKPTSTGSQRQIA
jgi:hypothetical protein